MTPSPRPQSRCPGKGPTRRGGGQLPTGDAPGRQCGGAGRTEPRPARGCPTQGFSLPFQSRNRGLLFLLSCPPAARNPQVTISQAYKEAQAADPCVSTPASEIGSLPHSRKKKATLNPT